MKRDSANSYSLIGIRNMYKLGNLQIISAIQDGYVSVVGDGDNLESYYTDRKGLNYFKRQSNLKTIGSVGTI